MSNEANEAKTECDHSVGMDEFGLCKDCGIAPEPDKAEEVSVPDSQPEIGVDITTTIETAVVPIVGKLPATRFRPGEEQFNHWRIAFADGTTAAMIETEQYWSHVAMHVKPGHTFDGMTDDRSVYMRGIVVATGRQYANVKVIEVVDLAAVPMKIDKPLFESEFTAGPSAWRVRRLSDGAIMIDARQTKEHADTWIKSHLEAVKR